MSSRSADGPRGLLALIGVALAMLLALGNGVPSAADRDGPTVLEARSPPERPWGPAVGFSSRERLEEHYRKHGSEFGDISRQEYLRLAQALRDASPGGPILEAVRRDGVITRFDRNTGAFVAVNPDGVIRTFFRPRDGERYFRRQLQRDL